MTDTEISPRNTWTAERVAQLRDCVIAGLTCSQIANEIGVSRNAVIGKINRLGLSRGRSPAAPRARLGSRLGSRVGGPRRRPQVLTQRLALETAFGSRPMAEDVVSAEPCSLLSLAPHKCRWPINGAGGSAFTFCGNFAEGDMSYCIGHARLAYRMSPRARSS